MVFSGVVSFGDFDRDQDVDGADFLLWQRSYGQTASPAGSGPDGNRDGVINGADLTVWKSMFGTASQQVLSLPVAAPSLLAEEELYFAQVDAALDDHEKRDDGLAYEPYVAAREVVSRSESSLAERRGRLARGSQQQRHRLFAMTPLSGLPSSEWRPNAENLDPSYEERDAFDLALEGWTSVRTLLADGLRTRD